MKILALSSALFFSLLIVSCKNHEEFSALDFFPNNIDEAESKGFSKVTLTSLKNNPDAIDVYQKIKNDTIVRLIFQNEKLTNRAFLFSYKNFDSSNLFANLSKIGDLVKHNNSNLYKNTGMFRKGHYIYFVLETSDGIILTNSPSGTTTPYSGPIIEPSPQ